MFVLADSENQGAVIKVVGVGGGGGNAVTHMVNSGIEGVDFICINTDSQALKHSKVKMSLQIGQNITKGLGAGADPEVGRQAAMEDRDRIVDLIDGSDMIFITAGMGGGTGTGAAPVVAQVAKELGILTVAVVTKPFEMEGNKRLTLAEQGINELGKHVDSLITIPNQKLLTVLGGDTTLLDAFRSANVRDLVVVRGFAKDTVNLPGATYVDNDAWQTTGEVASLAAAKGSLEGAACLVSYGDVMFKKNVLDELLEAEGDFVIAVDSLPVQDQDKSRVADWVMASEPHSRKTLLDTVTLKVPLAVTVIVLVVAPLLHA